VRAKAVREGATKAPVHVLLIEHRADDAELVVRALSTDRGPGHRVTIVDRFSDAEAALSQSPPEVVVLDPEVPDSHGLEGLARIRDSTPTVAVVVFSAATDLPSVRAAYESGAQGFEEKREFPKGLLARRLATARLLHRTEEHLRSARELPESDRSALNRLSDGVAIVAGGRFLLLNEAAARILARAKASDHAAVAQLLVPTAPSEGSPGAVGGRTVHVGEFPTVRSDGRKSVVRYVRRSFPHRGGPRIVIRLWETRPPGKEGRRTSPTPEGRARPPVRAHRSPTRPEAAPILDPQGWKELEELGQEDPAFVPTTVSHFLADADQKLRALWPAVDALDLPRVAEVAHALRVGSAQVAARILSRACERLEEAAASGRRSEVLGLARLAEREFQRAATELRPRAGPD
jgi:DNA-binding response OmpR family regulator